MSSSSSLHCFALFAVIFLSIWFCVLPASSSTQLIVRAHIPEDDKKKHTTKQKKKNRRRKPFRLNEGKRFSCFIDLLLLRFLLRRFSPAFCNDGLSHLFGTLNLACFCHFSMPPSPLCRAHATLPPVFIVDLFQLYFNLVLLPLLIMITIYFLEFRLFILFAVDCSTVACSFRTNKNKISVDGAMVEKTFVCRTLLVYASALTFPSICKCSTQLFSWHLSLPRQFSRLHIFFVCVWRVSCVLYNFQWFQLRLVCSFLHIFVSFFSVAFVYDLSRLHRLMLCLCSILACLRLIESVRRRFMFKRK